MKLLEMMLESKNYFICRYINLIIDGERLSVIKIFRYVLFVYKGVIGEFCSNDVDLVLYEYKVIGFGLL